MVVFFYFVKKLINILKRKRKRKRKNKIDKKLDFKNQTAKFINIRV